MGVGLPSPGVPAPLAPGEFQQSAPQNVVTFGLQGVGPPSQLYVQRDDVLEIFAVSFLDAESINITARLLPAAPLVTGQPAPSTGPVPPGPAVPGSTPIVVIQQTLVIKATKVPEVIRIPLSEGYLLSVGVFANAASLRGQTFVRGHIQRNFAATNQPFNALPLFADYATNYHLSGWPWGRSLHPSEGPGYINSIHHADPLPGHNFSLAVPNPDRWRLQSVHAQLASSNAVAVRLVSVHVTDPSGNVVWSMAANATQIASLTRTYNFAVAEGVTLTDPAQLYIPAPHDLRLGVGWSMAFVTANLDAGDQWSQIYAGVEDWLDAD